MRPIYFRHLHIRKMLTSAERVAIVHMSSADLTLLTAEKEEEEVEEEEEEEETQG